MPFFASIHLHDGLCVDGQVLVRVHHHTEQSRICLEEAELTQLKQVHTNIHSDLQLQLEYKKLHMNSKANIHIFIFILSLNVY